MRFGGAIFSSGGGGGFETVFKTADETINSDDTLTDDADLQFEVEANDVFALFHYIYAEGHATPDIKTSWGGPAGTEYFTIAGFSEKFTGSIQSAERSQDMFGVSNAGSLTGVGFPNHLGMLGVILVGGSAGTFAFQWAQNVSSVEDTILKRGSWLAFRKMN